MPSRTGKTKTVTLKTQQNVQLMRLTVYREVVIRKRFKQVTGRVVWKILARFSFTIWRGVVIT